VDLSIFKGFKSRIEAINPDSLTDAFEVANDCVNSDLSEIDSYFDNLFNSMK